MNIIIEGPDGAGKSTLARHFESLGWKSAPRACTSEGGQLDICSKLRWVYESLSWDGYVIDRHPIFSGYVYDHVLERETLRTFPTDYILPVLLSSTVVYCRPPGPVIRDAAARTPQMSGVLQRIGRIIDEYDRLFSLIPAVRYDWTRDELPCL